MDAISDYERTITATGTITMPETFATLNVLNAGSNSSRIRIEHNWVAPDPFKGFNPGIRLSDYHYWKVDGIFDPGFLTKATIGYNGSTTSLGYLDNDLFTAGITEDSLVLLYRRDVASDWQIVNGYTVNKGASSFDKSGNIVIDTLKKGEYTFGVYDHTITGLSEGSAAESYKLTVSPNPAGANCRIYFDLKVNTNGFLQIIDSSGKIVLHSEIKKDQEFYNWTTGKQPAGTYLIRFLNGNNVLGTTRLVLIK